jgi:hypothetical protein
MSIKFKPTQAVLDNISRGVALSKKYQRESLAGQQRIQQVNITKSYLDDGFDIKAVSNIYHTLSKLEKSIKPDARLWDGGCTDDVIKYYAHGGKAGLAWSKLILKEQGMLVSQTREITKAETEEVETDSVGSIPVAKSFNEELRQVTYVAMKAGVDLHNDYVSKDEVRLAKESFNKSLMKANLFHSVMTDTFSIIESYLLPATSVLNGNIVEEGEWLVTLQVHDEEVWKMIKNDEITGVSIGAMASVEELKED